MINLRKPKGEGWPDSEDSLQIKCAELTKKELLKRGLPQMFFHPANGGTRSKREASRFKLMGLQAGVSDIIMLIPAGGFHGFICELKNGKGKLDPRQEVFLTAATEQGYLAIVVDCFEVYKENLLAYLELKK